MLRPAAVSRPPAATPSAACMICFSDSTEHGPAITMNSSPPISQPSTRMRVRSVRYSLLTNLYGAEMRTAFSTCGMASTDSRQAVVSPSADGADHDALLALDGVDLVAEVPNALAHLLDLLFGRVEFHRDDHRSISSKIKNPLFRVGRFC